MSHKVNTKLSKLSVTILSIIIVAALSSPVLATNGYFSSGYGANYMALAGAGAALPLDSLGVAINPALAVFLGTQIDLGVALFNPNREYTITGDPSLIPGTFGLIPGTVESDKKYFGIPTIGINAKTADYYSITFSLYGNGGMNTHYLAPTFYGSIPTRINLVQLFLTSTLAFKIYEKHGIGATLIFTYQDFEARGLEAFASVSRNPLNLSNRGSNDSTGIGMRFGYFGKWSEYFSVGASFQTKIYMSDLDRYNGLLAGSGGFDIPATWTVGMAYMLNERLTLVFDVQHIYYSKIKSVGNPFHPSDFIEGRLLGDDDGPGFGWEDMTIFKGGMQWNPFGSLTLRAGYSYGKQPIPASQVFFNILAPGVIEHHLTFGISMPIWKLKKVSIAVMHAISNSVIGPNPMELTGLQTIELKMNQWQFEFGISF